MNCEAWLKKEDVDKLKTIEKGKLLTIEGFFKPEEWTDKDGKKHNKVVLVATKFYPTVFESSEKK